MYRKLRWLLLVVILAAFAVWLEPTRVVWGWLRGEAFYDGRPTCWWERALRRWEIVGTAGPIKGSLADPNVGLVQRSQLPVAARLRGLFVRNNMVGEMIIDPTFDAQGPVLFHGDPAAEPVLRELANDCDDHIRALAYHGLRQINFTRNSNNAP